MDLPITTPEARKINPNKDAYNLYLQGRALISRTFGSGVLDTAISLLEEALQLDPDLQNVVRFWRKHMFTKLFIHLALIDRNNAKKGGVCLKSYGSGTWPRPCSASINGNINDL